jgi:hypothetical protein
MVGFCLIIEMRSESYFKIDSYTFHKTTIEL